MISPWTPLDNAQVGTPTKYMLLHELDSILFRRCPLEYYRSPLILQDRERLPEKPLVHPKKVLCMMQKNGSNKARRQQ